MAPSANIKKVASDTQGVTQDILNRVKGSGEVNLNKPFGNNPFVYVPGNVDESPTRLLLLDILFVLQKSTLLPMIIWPLWPNISGPLDELAFTWPNMWDLFLQFNLLWVQVLLVLLFPIMALAFWFLPGIVVVGSVICVVTATKVTMRMLNGLKTTECLVGLPGGGREPVNEEEELWFFINGVATGKNWLQNNLDLLARTFQREVVGIHNTTYGFIFDLLECLVQRDLDYKTHDIRQARTLLRKALLAPSTKKLVLILHSQGGIEGSSVLDWLLSELSHEIVAKLEIFSFGNAARKFNNPLVSHHKHEEIEDGRGERVIKHLEHYANSGDFVAQFGVLAFTSPEHQPFVDGNAFAGTVFNREGTGHLLNMHYLDTMFTMKGGRVIEDGNDFMNSVVPEKRNGLFNGLGHLVNGRSPRQIKDMSRLWQYINGKKPSD